jgi:hypothetical protein
MIDAGGRGEVDENENGLVDRCERIFYGGRMEGVGCFGWSGEKKDRIIDIWRQKIAEDMSEEQQKRTAGVT